MWCLEDQEETFNQMIDQLSKQNKAIIKLSQYIDRINVNSNSPFDNDVEEEIFKILE